ncbi:DapH/DapD/GlmU-related protein [Pedobacter agri]|uniref:DapH/DapD/GlmU-related protein n=1 Tax=Pedobacter agri TaxID=454586 RepID=UPI00292D77B7|nr:DapH/DapD/GlmU-related protein [Pedobacter agri]
MYRFATKIVQKIYARFRIYKYRFLSSCKNIHGAPKLIGPALFNGDGSIDIDDSVTIGTVASPHFYNTYVYLEARRNSALIIIHENVFISNNASLISEASRIEIGAGTLIGVNFSAMDSDFHNLHPNQRMIGNQTSSPILIGNNVFIGANVTILKGVTIGDNSVIGSNSVVTKSIPKNVIAAGVPCKVLKNLI